MYTSTFQIAIWYLSLAFQAGVIGVLFHTGLRKRFPLFLFYSISELSRTLILMAVFLPFAQHGHLSQFSGAYHVYFYAWRGLQLLVFAFQVALLWEIWHHVHLDKLVNAKIFAGLLSFFAVVIAAVSTYSPVVSYSNNPLLASMLTANRALQFVACMMFICLIGFGGLLRLHWRQHVLCIAAGFALYESSECLVSGFRSAPFVGSVGYQILVNVSSVVYIISLGMWIVGLLNPEPVPPPLTAEDAVILRQIHTLLRENPLYVSRQ